jgi:hypothetical protein
MTYRPSVTQVPIEAPSPRNHHHREQVRLILNSYRHWTGEDLLAPSQSASEIVFSSPFALVSHGTESDPIFNYANQMALQAFGYRWDEWVCLPSRLSAEAHNREARQKLLDEVRRQGFSADYQGIRTGKAGRFFIRNARVWNLIDASGTHRGQAAYFKDWERLPADT